MGSGGDANQLAYEKTRTAALPPRPRYGLVKNDGEDPGLNNRGLMLTGGGQRATHATEVDLQSAHLRPCPPGARPREKIERQRRISFIICQAYGAVQATPDSGHGNAAVRAQTPASLFMS